MQNTALEQLAIGSQQVIGCLIVVSGSIVVAGNQKDMVNFDENELESLV